MIAKLMILTVVALVVSVESGVIPALPYAVAPYASSYNAHYVNHAVAAPLVAAHAYAAPVSAPLIAGHPVAAPAYTAALPAAYTTFLGR